MHYWIYAATGGQTGTGCTAFKWEGQAPLAPLLATGLGRVLFAGLLQLLTEHGP